MSRTHLEKRSVTIQGHRTSIALEPEFWAVIDAVVARRQTSFAALIAAIDEARDRPLASALRLFCLTEAKGR